MSERFDAIIIGAGIIGASIGLELARKGWKTLNLDALPAAGYGSTSGSCAIIRTHYSTYDGCAMAYEGFFYWKDWERYLEAEDERGQWIDDWCTVAWGAWQQGRSVDAEQALRVLSLADERPTRSLFLRGHMARASGAEETKRIASKTASISAASLTPGSPRARAPVSRGWCGRAPARHPRSGEAG